MDHSLEFFEDNLIHINFLPDQVFSLVLRIVAVAQPAIISELELEELMPEFSLMPNVVAKVEFFAPAPTPTPSVRTFSFFISCLPVLTLVAAHIFVFFNILFGISGIFSGSFGGLLVDSSFFR